MAFKILRKVAGKAKRTILPNKQITIKSQKWMKEQAMQFDTQAKRHLKKTVVSNGENRQAYPHLSRAIEYAINNILDTQKMDFENMYVIKNPYQYAPLNALALFKTNHLYKVRVTVKGKTADCDVSYTLKEAKTHRVPILGLYADYENKIEIELLDSLGKRRKIKEITLNTAPLKGKMPTVNITNDVSVRKYIYGLTLVYGGDDGVYPYAFDRNGDIRFVFSMIPKTYGFQPISNGRFLFLNKNVTRLTCTNTASTQLFEVDQMGRVHKIYNVEKGAHHDFSELENGNIVTAGNCMEGQTFEDTVIEIDRITGDIVNEINIKDYIDSNYVKSPDWAHLNTVEYNDKEKTVMVCLRNLHTIVKINYEKKEIVWILSHPDMWKDSTVADKVLKPIGDMKWFFQAHAAYTIDVEGAKDGEKYVIIYDNHTDKRQPVSYFDNDENSNARIYVINEKMHTVSLFKSFSFEKSTIRSNAIYEKEAGSVLAMNGKLKSKDKKRKGSIIEFDYNSGEILNQYSMNYGFYRAYEFNFEAEEMSKAIGQDSNYVLGHIYGLETSDAIDVSEAKTVPEPVLIAPDTTEEERSERLTKICKKNYDYDDEYEQDMARIKLTIEENTAYLHLLDHQLERVYLVGKCHTYFRDYTDTEQIRPEYFARANNIDAIPLEDLENDHYEIYFKHKKGLYKSKYFIKIS